MVRSIILVTLKPGATDEQVQTFIDALNAVQFEKRHNPICTRDLGLREGNADVVIMADFDDDAAYEEWMDFPPHADVRSNLLGPIADRRDRALIRL
jgi:hypothetical protein